ncbi:MAG: 5-(carboxyamino)imidazole ribonucleotide synthase [Anaerolineae bacterium]|nr:5-(carboxyamino)imidazole ribonucleotide synthase [Anaerolineae bacterium]MDQ7035541.1 5-(carboxyamino)imidazole ribonucleotide synthase [Anaerolineae bacterium]
MPTIGIFGGGQVAKMTAQAASIMDVEVVIFAHQADDPALKIAPKHLIGKWDDDDLLQQFAEMCDVVTLESEFVPLDSLKRIEALGTSVYASSNTIEQVRDKLIQKRRMQQSGIDVPRFRPIMVGSDVLEASAEFGFPLILKSRTHSYNGFGNVTIRRAHDIEPALEKLKGRELMAEEMVSFVRELAVIVTRGQNGDFRVYPVVETIHKHHICHIVRCPASIEESTAAIATEMAVKAVEAIDGVGTFGVELFELANNQVIYNEIAPRPHNSGHYTIEGIITSQFENHIRAILGWHLGDVAQIAPATVMINMLGDGNGTPNPDALKEMLQVGGTHVHLYGKSEIREGRKMGHITVLGYSTDGAEKVARLALSKLNLLRNTDADD